MSFHGWSDASESTPPTVLADYTNNQRSIQELTATVDETSETTGVKSFVDRGEVLLLFEDQRLIVHAYKIKEFTRINDILIDNPSEVGRPQTIGLPEKAANFAKALELLYTPVYNATTPSIDTLLSALNMATKYCHPSLRAYAVNALSSRSSELSPVERIEVARACDIPEWVSGAIDELCEREERITLEEANRLGVEVFGDVSRRREQRVYNRGWKDMGAVSSQPMTYTCSDIRLEGPTLHAMTVCSSAKWDGPRKSAYFHLDHVIANDNGHFIWVPQGCFSRSARNIALQGTTLTADLECIGGGWRTDSIELNGKFYGLDGVIFDRGTPIEV
ncbi:hypothetical protein FRC06_010884 [Ceratobasidium sp. 370]|nr:hypothetical protein FRC06_010884 [Ceratobasidium sp. 370]